MPTADFWKGLVDQGLIQGDPTYYSSGRAQPGEVAHALRIAWGGLAAAPLEEKTRFWGDLVAQGYIEGDPAYYATGQAQPAEFEHAFQVADQLALTQAPDSGSAIPPPGTIKVGTSVIPEGTRLIRILNPAGSDLGELFILVGSAFGVELAYEIGDAARLQSLFGGIGAFGNVTTVSQAEFDNGGAITVGDVDEVLGATGSIQAQLERDMRAVGLENPPAWITADQKAMATYVTAVNEGFSAERTWGELAKTDAFKGRFRGIETIMGQLGTTQLTQAVAEFTRREDAIRASLISRRGPDAVTDGTYVSSLIGSGWDPAEVDELLVLERQLVENPEALDNMNQILAFQGLPGLTAGDFITFLQEGQRVAADKNFTPGQIFEGVNDALRFQALLEEDIAVSAEFATELGTGASDAIESPESFSERARIAAIELARNASEVDLQTMGIQRDDIVAAIFGEEAPSGKSVSEVSLLLERLGRDRAKRAQGLPNVASFIDALGRLRIQGSTNL